MHVVLLMEHPYAHDFTSDKVIINPLKDNIDYIAGLWNNSAALKFFYITVKDGNRCMSKGMYIRPARIDAETMLDASSTSSFARTE